MNIKQSIDLDGREYVLDKFAEQRADELLPDYWQEYMQTGRVDDFDIDSYSLESDALASGISDFKTGLREHIKREIIVAANNSNLPREWRIKILGMGEPWS